MKKIAILSIILILVSACSTDPYTGEKKVSNTGKGAMIGAGVGATIGAVAGGGRGAVIGAGVGTAVGAGTGGYLDMQAKALRQELEGTGVKVIKEGDQIRLIMPGNITFTTNSYELKDSFKPTLDSVAKVLKKYNKTFAKVYGYTDNTGSAATNNALSFSRANSVANYLKLKGISADRMLVEGKGSSNPIASNAIASGREQNRRVEITLTQQ